MGNERLQHHLRHLTGKVAARLAESRAALAVRATLEPSAGDVFVVADCPAPVEWVIVEDGPAEGHREAVPADDQPFAGSGDLRAVLEDGGILTLRLGLAARLDPARFDPRLRTGVLTPGSLEAARRRKATYAIREASWREQRADADPTYRAWLEEVAATQVALRSNPRKKTPGE